MRDFYIVENFALSPNISQNEREKNFLYCNRECRKSVAQVIIENKSFKKGLNEINRFIGTGKPHYLADFVFRYRLADNTTNFRVLYFNNPQEFLAQPLSYIREEFIYMLWHDIGKKKIWL